MSKGVRTYRGWLIGLMCLSAFCMLLAGNATPHVLGHTLPAAAPPDDKPKKGDDRIHLIHTDLLYKTEMDPRTDILVGHVRLFHTGIYLDCDSARFYKEDNSFDAFGHVKMVQGDTLSLVGDTLFYDGIEMKARARGKCTMVHRKTRLVTEILDYDRMYGVGMYLNGGTLYDGDNVLVSDWGQYTPATHEAFFTDNVELKGYEESDKKHERDPKFTLISDTLYYYTDTKRASIVTPTNITSSDGTFVYGERGTYLTTTGLGDLLDRSYIIKDMRKIVGDSLHCDSEKGFNEAFGNVIMTDDENMCMLTGNYCSYDENLGLAVATDSAVAYEYSQRDTLYVHGDTLKMYTYNMDTDSAYHDLYAYHRVRIFRNDIQAVCDSMVTHELDSCTYMYGQPIMWNDKQQIFGEEIRVYNNDSTITRCHIINQALTAERIDSVSYNQVSSKEMFVYFIDGEIDHTESHGNVIANYFLIEDNGNRIGMNNSETTQMNVYMERRKVKRIWMAGATGTIYPIIKIPDDKRYLTGFAWFDYIRPKSKDDIFDWRSKSEENVLKATEKKTVPLQKLNNI